MRHFELAASNARQGFQRQRRLPQLQVLLSSPSPLPGLGHLSAAQFVLGNSITPVDVDWQQEA